MAADHFDARDDGSIVYGSVDEYDDLSDDYVEPVKLAQVFVFEDGHADACYHAQVPQWVIHLLLFVRSTASLHGLLVQHGHQRVEAISEPHPRLYYVVANMLAIYLCGVTGAACEWNQLLSSLPTYIMPSDSFVDRACIKPNGYTMLALWFFVHASTAQTSESKTARNFVDAVRNSLLPPQTAFCYYSVDGLQDDRTHTSAVAGLDAAVDSLVQQLVASTFGERFLVHGSCIAITTVFWELLVRPSPMRMWTLTRKEIRATSSNGSVDLGGTFLEHNQAGLRDGMPRPLSRASAQDPPKGLAATMRPRVPSTQQVQAHACAAQMECVADMLRRCLHVLSSDRHRKHANQVVGYADEMFRILADDGAADAIRDHSVSPKDLGTSCSSHACADGDADEEAGDNAAPHARRCKQPIELRRQQNRLHAKKSRHTKALASVMQELTVASQFWLNMCLLGEDQSHALSGGGAFQSVLDGFPMSASATMTYNQAVCRGKHALSEQEDSDDVSERQPRKKPRRL